MAVAVAVDNMEACLLQEQILLVVFPPPPHFEWDSCKYLDLGTNFDHHTYGIIKKYNFRTNRRISIFWG